ncbi:MAG: zinc ABC transporter permease [Gammaproteobacteria bacterium]|nr:zinc ABC transporter permease [Gammaproteobacteria bacterium]
MEFAQLISEPFAYGFMQRALVGCFALSLGAAPLGVFLMLRRLSLTGDAMAHALLPGVALGYLVAGLSVPAMTIGGVIAGLLVAVLAGIVARTTAAREDASLAAFYLISLAAGVAIISSQGSSVDLLRVLFGTVLALDDDSLMLIAGVTSLTLLVMAVILRGLIAECVDPAFMRTVSRAGGWIHMIFLGLVVLNLVGGFQALGTLMVVGIMILPGAAARFWVRSISSMLVLAIAFGWVASVAGLLLSYYVDAASGPMVILAAGGIYVISLLFGRVDGYIISLLPRKHLHA